MGLTCPEPQAAGFLADADRFHTDTSGEEFLARKAKHEEKQLQYDQKRVSRVEREEARWQAIEEKKAEEEKYWDDQRESGAKAMKNNLRAVRRHHAGGITTASTATGCATTTRRCATARRCARRTSRACGDTRTGYNIISGHSRPNAAMCPTRPSRAAAAAVHMEEEAIRAEQEEGEDFRARASTTP